MRTFNLTVTEQELSLLWQGLGKLTIAEGFQFVVNINQQLEAQINPPPAPPEPAPATPAD